MGAIGFTLRIAIAGIAALLVAETASAQNYPYTLPPLSVIGNSRPQASDAYAVTFDELKAALVVPTVPQNSNTVYAGPIAGGPITPGFRSLVGADLPTPTALALGGVLVSTCPTGQSAVSVQTNGSLGCAAVTVPLPTNCVIESTSATTCANGGTQAHNGVYSTPAGVTWIEVELCGGGGGGAGSGGSGSTLGSNGGNTTFGALAGSAGLAPGTQTSAGNGGSASGGYLNMTGGAGGPGSLSISTPSPGGNGGSSPFGSFGQATAANTGGSAAANSCSGGAGGSVSGTPNGGGGGGAGGYVRAIIQSPNGTYSYSVGAGGAAGQAGTGGLGGGAGGSGLILVKEHYGS